MLRCEYSRELLLNAQLLRKSLAPRALPEGDLIIVSRLIIVAHNFYRSASPSGENAMVQREVALLTEAGQNVRTLYRSSDDLLRTSASRKLRALWQLHAPERAVDGLVRELTQLGAGYDDVVLHAHNVWPLFTYGLFEAAKRAGLRTVQTLHNYRLVATNTHFLRKDGSHVPVTAEESMHLRNMAAMHGSRLLNRFLTNALRRYWLRGIPQTLVDTYICLSDFQRKIMLEAGIPASKLTVKPNFLDHRGDIGTTKGEYALFVGRLSSEKGISELLDAWPETGLPLKVAGDGPLGRRLPTMRSVEFLGRQSEHQVHGLMANARMLVMNSRWYEPFGLVLIEALAAGTPCLVPNLGAMPEIIEDARLGRVFEPDNKRALIDSARRLWDEAPALRAACRREYELRYTAKVNLDALLRIYREAGV